MSNQPRTRITEPKLYLVTGPGAAVHVVKALTKAGAVSAVADLIVSEPLSAVDAIALRINPERVIDATTTPVSYPVPAALAKGSTEPTPGVVHHTSPEPQSADATA